MRLGSAMPKRIGIDVEKRRVGQLCAPAAEIVAGMEDELEPPCARLSALISGLSVRPSALVTTSTIELALGPLPNS